jgi:hypothetical protein
MIEHASLMLRDVIALFIGMHMLAMTRQLDGGICRHEPLDIDFEHNRNDAANDLSRQTNSLRDELQP